MSIGLSSTRAYVLVCHRCCASTARSPPKHTPEQWPKATVYWQIIHVDFVGLLGIVFYLVVVDAYSKWTEIFPAKSITSKAPINLIRSLVANKGMHAVLVPEFKEFENGVKHVGSTVAIIHYVVFIIALFNEKTLFLRHSTFEMNLVGNVVA